MIYQQLIQDLFSKRKRKASKDREQLITDMQRLGHPQRSYPTVHVAGTNGKGSVTLKIAKTLEYAGYKVGLFTSPHIQNFGERIQINGIEISEEEVVRLLPPLMERFPDYCFFDYTTFLAFQYFREKNIDIAVFETGIGGLHDTTNVIEPIATVITSVGFDHVELLGRTIDEIAFQKAGIIKPNIPIVVGPKARLKPIYDRASAASSPLIEVQPVDGDYDLENQAIARAAIKILSHDFSIPEQALEKGLVAKPPCRFERHGRFVLDVAHNAEGFQSLVKAWNYHHPEKKFVAVVGLASDKDIETCLKLIGEKAEHLFLVMIDSKKAASIEMLSEILNRLRISKFTPCLSIESAIKNALTCDQDILVCGSFYIMKQAREQIFGLQVS